MKEIYLLNVVRFWAENDLNLELINKIQNKGNLKSIRGVKYFVIVNQVKNRIK